MTPVETLTAALAGHYRVERELGAGGMATVYLAHDLKHERRVAIKVLRPELAAIIGAERFLSEIRTTANLQHPHILPLHDSGRTGRTGGQTDGGTEFLYYVMPFIEGESLRDRLVREKQLPIADAIRIAIEVASALDYAHRHGVIHRDIKPENILLHEGRALVADFGIALAASSAGTRMTETGMSLGTPTYMSPEQAMGERNLDARTDVYALGCVVYEMLTGEPPFTGPTAQSIVAKVLSEAPVPPSRRRGAVREPIEDAVMVALEKLPADRFASAAEFSAALSGTTSGTPRRTSVTVASRRTPGSPRMVLLLAGALAITAAVAGWGWVRPAPADGPVSRAYVRFPEEESLVARVNAFDLLPDGSALVYEGKGQGGTQLWIKKRSELHATPLGGTVGGTGPFVSPDGKWVGFFEGGRLKKVAVGGGEPVTLADAPCASLACRAQGGSGAWLEDGRIAFPARDAIVLVSSNGGPGDSVVTSAMVGGLSPVLPSALPGARGVVFSQCTLYCNKSDVMVVDLASRKVRLLVENATYPKYLPSGHLVYVDARGVAMADAFDPGTLELEGAPVPILERVGSRLAVARTGELAYLDGETGPRSDLVVVTRSGGMTPVDSGWRGNFTAFTISPDGKRVGASVATEGEEHVWIKTLGGGPPARLTVGKHQNAAPTWSADGSVIYFTRFQKGGSSFLSKRADGTGPEATVQSGSNWVIESAVSRDGAWLVTRQYRDGGRDIFAQRMGADTTLRTVVSTPSADVSPTLSPNGKFLAYTSEDVGDFEVWVVPFPDPQGARWQVSTDGGSEPVWSPDGRGLYYVNGANELVAVELSTGGGFSTGAHRTLFSVGAFRRHPTHRAYDVLPDGRFVMIRNGTAGPRALVLVENWLAEVASKLRK